MSAQNIIAGVFLLALTAGAFLAIEGYETPPAKVERIDLSTDDLEVVLRRTSCFGPCPVYTAHIEGSGDVIFIGERYTETAGEVRAVVVEDDLFLLALEIERTDFFDYKEKKECVRGWTDSPSVELWIKWRGRERRVQRYLGCVKAAPDPVPELANFVDDIIGTERWIGDGEKQWP